MKLDLREIRKAIAGLVGSAVTAGVTIAALKLGVGVEVVAPLAAFLTGVVGRLVFLIPNEIDL